MILLVVMASTCVLCGVCNTEVNVVIWIFTVTTNHIYNFTVVAIVCQVCCLLKFSSSSDQFLKRIHNFLLIDYGL